MLKKLKCMKELNEKIYSLEKEVDSLNFKIKNLEINSIKKELEKHDNSIKLLLDEINPTLVNTKDEIEFRGDDEGVGMYLCDVKVYEEIDLYRIGEICDYAGNKSKVHNKTWEKGNITISLKVSSKFSSKKEVFNAIKRVYSKLLEYFRE